MHEFMRVGVVCYLSIDHYLTLSFIYTRMHNILAGTPVQNSPKELMSLLCFLMPLFSRSSGSSSEGDFEENKDDGGENMLQHFVNIEGSGGSDRDAYAKLKHLFAPFVLRRRKMDVLSQLIPPKVRYRIVFGVVLFVLSYCSVYF